MKKNKIGRFAAFSIMLSGILGNRQATPEEIKMLSDFLRSDDLAD